MTTYVLDTSVLLSAGKKALYTAEKGSNVVIPLGVVRELERVSKRSADLGWVARGVLRELEKIYHSNSDLSVGGRGRGVKVGDHFLRVEMNHRANHKDIPSSAQDESNAILVALNLRDEEYSDLVFVCNDLTKRMVAHSLKIKTESFNRESLQGEYTGLTTVKVNDSHLISKLYEDGSIPTSRVPESEDAPPHHCFLLKCGDQSAVTFRQKDKLFVFNADLVNPNSKVKGRSLEQKIALRHLSNDEARIVSLGGQAGTGKTLLALAVGAKMLHDGKVNRIIVFRPLSKVGQEDIGFLPGTEKEKLAPWAEAIRDALLVWMTPNAVDKMFADGSIEVQSSSFIRGRTLEDSFVLIDEAQNYERLSILSLLSRLGENSKCVMSWDAAQRDNLFIGQDDGVLAIVDRLKDENLFAHVTLQKSERSQAAELASQVLEELDL